MRILCCLDGTNVEAVSGATEMLSQDLVVAIIYVVDQGPHQEIEHTRERFFRPPAPPPARERQMREVEQSSAREIVDEGLRYLPGAESSNARGARREKLSMRLPNGGRI
jgi:hypothetical protein